MLNKLKQGFLSSSFLLFSFLSSNTLWADHEIKIRVITVSDLHATIFPWDFTNQNALQNSLAHVNGFVEQERARPGQSVILLDNGDLLQGQPSGYYYNFVATDQPHLIRRVMNYMQFDASSVGNHDIETGPDVYNKLKEEFDFPWLAANIIHIKSGEPFFKPYIIIEREDVRIAILGLVTPSIPNWLPRRLWEGLEFRSMFSAALEWMNYIKENENPDAFIGLFHSGAGPDLDYKADSIYLENAARYVGEFVPGFDVIFTAHDHQVRNEKFINSDGKEVLMVGGAPYGRSVSVADLTFMKSNDEKIKLISKSTEIVNVSEYDSFEPFLKEFQNEFLSVQNFVNKPLGQLNTELSSRDGFFGNSAFTDFIHSIQLELTSADISLAAPLSFDATLKPGVLKMSDMFKLYQYENYLYVMELSGREIKDFLEYSYGLWLNSMSSADDHMLLFRTDEDGLLIRDQRGRARFENPFFNFDSAAGIIYSVNLSQKPGDRIVILGMEDGNKFDSEKLYSVAINSYRGSGGGGHLTRGAGIAEQELEGRIRFVSEKDMRSHIADYISKKNTLSPQKADNWKIIPEKWIEKAAKRDYEILFGE